VDTGGRVVSNLVHVTVRPGVVTCGRTVRIDAAALHLACILKKFLRTPSVNPPLLHRRHSSNRRNSVAYPWPSTTLLVIASAAFRCRRRVVVVVVVVVVVLR